MQSFFLLPLWSLAHAIMATFVFEPNYVQTHRKINPILKFFSGLHG